MIAQAWNRHETERFRTSWGPRKIHQALIADFEDEMKSFVTDEIFIQPLNLAHSSYALGDSNEVLENAQVSKNVLMPKNAKASKNVQLPENAKVSKNTLWQFNSLLLNMAHLWLILLWKMVTFHSYVSLPEEALATLKKIANSKILR